MVPLFSSVVLNVFVAFKLYSAFFEKGVSCWSVKSVWESTVSDAGYDRDSEY